MFLILWGSFVSQGMHPLDYFSIILTQIFADILEYIQRAQNRRMSAMMVLGNVESFAHMLEQHSVALAHNDTVGRWLLAQPLAYLDTMPPIVKADWV